VDDDVLTLARLARLLERACGELESPLTLPQYRLLAMIGGGAERASQIAGRLALTKPTVSATIDTLVERGLISRTTADDDRRALRLGLTPEGTAELRIAEHTMRARLDDVFAHVERPDEVRRALLALASALDARQEERRAARARS
jgi:DNA-binding MarR family transcriptional regulator